MSGMPNKACLFPGATKNLHIFCTLLCLFLHYICQIVLLLMLYIFNWTFLFLVAANCSFVALGNNFCISVKALCYNNCCIFL